MTITTLATWVVAVLGVLAALFVFLPAGSSVPYPHEVTDALIYFYHALYSFNGIFPVSTMITVLSYAVTLLLLTRIVIPIGLWIVKTITGAGQ